MGLTEEQIGVKMRLMGKAEYVAGMDAATESTAAYGDAAERAGKQAKGAAAGMDAAAASTKKSSSAGISAMKKMNKVGAGFRSTGKKMTTWMTLPIVAVGAASIDMALKFEKSVLLLHTQAGVAKSELKSLKRAFLDIARSTTFSPVEVSEAGFRLAGAGLRGKELEKATLASAQLAMVGGANPEDTAKTIAQVWYQNIKGAGDFNHIIGELNATVGEGDLRLPQLVDALGTGVVASAKAAGLSMQDVTAAMAVFGDSTNNVSGWAAQFATGLHYFTAPGDKAKKAMEALGLTQFQLSEDFNKPHGLKRGLIDLKEHLEALNGGLMGNEAKQILGEILPGGRGRVFLNLMNNLTHLEEKYHGIYKTQKNFNHALKETEENPMTQLQNAWSNLQASMVELGEVLIPVVVPLLKEAAEFIGRMARGFQELSPEAKKFVLIGVGIIAIAGPMVWVIGALISVVSALGTALMFLALNPVGIVITATALAAIGFYELYTRVKWFHEAVDDVVSFIKSHPWLLLFMGPMFQAIGIIVLLVEHFHWVVNAIKNVIHFFELLPERAWNELKQLPGQVKNLVVQALIFIATFPIMAPVYFVRFTIKVINILMGLLPKLLPIGAKMAKFIAHGLATGAVAVWNFIKNIPGKLIALVASIAPQLISVGAKIAGEIAKGIHEKIKETPVLGKALELGEGAVGGIVGGAEELFEGFAGGTNWAPGGVALVGEHGPELINLPRGSEVLNTARTRRVETTVGPLRTRGGPSAVRPETARERGAYGRRRARPVEVRVPLSIGRRQFGEAMAMAMIEDEENE